MASKFFWRVLLLFIQPMVPFCLSSRPEYIENTKYIDLTHAFTRSIAVWPGRKITRFTEWEGRDKNEIWSASYGFCTSEHTATHMDAPYHFSENGRRLHEIPFEDLIDIPGVKIDISDKVDEFKNGKLTVNENYGLTREDILEWERANGMIPPGAVVLVRTGWDTRWGDPKLFRGEKPQSRESGTHTYPKENKEDGNVYPPDKTLYDPSEASISTTLRFPGIDVSAAQFLTYERAVRGVGVDTISVDPGIQSVRSPAHQIFTSRNIYMLEMIANLRQVPSKDFNLWIVPFKIDRGTGAPTRVIARLKNYNVVYP